MKVLCIIFIKIIFLILSQYIFAECRFTSNSISSPDKETLEKFIDCVNKNDKNEAEKIILSCKIFFSSYMPGLKNFILTPIDIQGIFIKVIAHDPLSNNSLYLWTTKNDINCQ